MKEAPVPRQIAFHGPFSEPRLNLSACARVQVLRS
jgi:hypothetical protein